MSAGFYNHRNHVPDIDDKLARRTEGGRGEGERRWVQTERNDGCNKLGIFKNHLISELLLLLSSSSSCERIFYPGEPEPQVGHGGCSVDRDFQVSSTPTLWEPPPPGFDQRASSQSRPGGLKVVFQGDEGSAHCGLQNSKVWSSSLLCHTLSTLCILWIFTTHHVFHVNLQWRRTFITHKHQTPQRLTS